MKFMMSMFPLLHLPRYIRFFESDVLSHPKPMTIWENFIFGLDALDDGSYLSEAVRHLIGILIPYIFSSAHALESSVNLKVAVVTDREKDKSLRSRFSVVEEVDMKKRQSNAKQAAVGQTQSTAFIVLQTSTKENVSKVESTPAVNLSFQTSLSSLRDDILALGDLF
jgi:hypothetical protein